MNNIPRSLYRSMIRICKKEDPTIKKYLKYGISTFKEKKDVFHDFKYINDDKLYFICGPYYHETVNMLSYTKCLIRHGKKTETSTERLFEAHRELPNFFIAVKKLQLEECNKKSDNFPENTLENTPENVKPTTFGTSFY